MFIKEIKTVNKKTKREYIKHSLVESIRTEKGVRHRTIMQLGKLTISRDLWEELVAELESRISGQMSLNIPGIKVSSKVSKQANKIMSSFKIRSSRKVANKEDDEDGEVIPINIDKTASTNHRSIGAELVAHHTWNSLQMNQKLKSLGFDDKECSLTEAVVAGRLINPSSELSTFDWIKYSSAIGELTEKSLDEISLSSLYRIGDKILEHKKEIETHLFNVENRVHPEREMLYLFDLTNFYFEGQSLGNKLAQYGKSKEKRSDCPLVSLGLVVDAHGFPISSEVFEGNVGEVTTLAVILEKMKYFENYLPKMAPTLVMDRGIASKENIEFLKNKNIPYTVVTRGPRNGHYLDIFENHESDQDFETIIRNKKEIKIKKVENKENGTVEILCLSQGRREKESAMRFRWIEHASTDLASLQRSIRKGSIKNRDKIQLKLGRLNERYPSLFQYFDIDLKYEKGNYVSELTFTEKAVYDGENRHAENPLDGTYVIESVHTTKSASEIWDLYMTLTRVEEAFRCMKSDLGTRPIFHQIESRTRAHLFISVLAYHLQINIEYKLYKAGKHLTWREVRKRLKTHQRSTIILTDSSKLIYHLRVTSQVEAHQAEIYSLLNIKIEKKLIKKVVGRRL